MRSVSFLTLVLSFGLAVDVNARPARSRGTYNVHPPVVRAAAPTPTPIIQTRAISSDLSESADALDEVNAVRAARGLRPYIKDDGLTAGAHNAARFRAERFIAGHTSNDFAALPAGVNATAAGCAAWGGNEWGSCCTYENWTYAGAAWVRGSDGRRYMHLFVR